MMLFRELAELLSGRFGPGAPWFAPAVPYLAPVVIVTMELLIGHEAARAWTRWRTEGESMDQRVRDGLTVLAVAIALAVPIATLGAHLAGGGGLLDPKLWVVLILNLSCHGLVVARGDTFLDAVEQLWPWSGETSARRRVDNLREEYGEVREDTAREVREWLINAAQREGAGLPRTTNLDLVSMRWCNFIAGYRVFPEPGPGNPVRDPFELDEGSQGSRVHSPFDPPSPGGTAATKNLVLPAPPQTGREDERTDGPLPPPPIPDGDLSEYYMALVQAQVRRNDSAVTR